MSENSTKSSLEGKESQIRFDELSSDTKLIFDASKWYLQNYPIKVNSQKDTNKDNATSNNLEGPPPNENSVSKRIQLIKTMTVTVVAVALIVVFGIALNSSSNDGEYYRDSDSSSEQTVSNETTSQQLTELDTTSFDEEEQVDTIVQTDEPELIDSYDSVNDDEDVEINDDEDIEEVTTTEDYNIEDMIGGSPEYNPPAPEDYDDFDDYLDAYVDFYYNDETDDYDELYDELYPDAWDNYYN